MTEICLKVILKREERLLTMSAEANSVSKLYSFIILLRG